MRQARRSRESRRRDRYVVVYDVQDNRQRQRLAERLLDCGKRVGLSVFEVWVSTAALSRLTRSAEALLDPRTDRMHCYRLCERCAASTLRAGIPWKGEAAYVIEA